jgi:hypothetical protein
MSVIKVYIGCCKADFYLLRSCIASIRYWNKEVPVYLLKDFSKGDFDTTELEEVFNVSVVNTKYKKLGGYMKLQPYIEHPDERIFLQDADMVWLGDIMQTLKSLDEDIAVHAYKPPDVGKELNRWYFNTERLKKYYPNYQYPGFVFNCGSIFMNTKTFNETDFEDIIIWNEGAKPVIDEVFLCEDQGIINYVVAQKLSSNTIRIKNIDFQISAESAAAKTYSLERIKKGDPQDIIVHWVGKKPGLNSFSSSRDLLRFFEKQYYSNCKNGETKILIDRFTRTIKHLGTFIYEVAKFFYYSFIAGKK